MTEKRRQRTPRERAEGALGVAQRRVKKYEKGVADAESAVKEQQRLLAAARTRLDYAEADPALPAPAEPDAPSAPADEGDPA